MPKVSVLISAHNHDPYIARAIQSVLDQSFVDFELLIVDDCSTDKTWEIIQNFSDPRIQSRRLDERSYATKTYPLLLSMIAPSSKYITLLNSDDYYLPHKIEKQYTFLEQNIEYGAVFSDAVVVTHKDEPLAPAEHFYARAFTIENRTRYAWLYQFIQMGNCLCAPSFMGRRKYATTEYFDMRYIQLMDMNIWLKICRETNIYVLPEKLLVFRIMPNEGNLSGDRLPVKNRTWHELFELLTEFGDSVTKDELNNIFSTSSFNNKESAACSFGRLLILDEKRPVYKLAGLHLLYKNMEPSVLKDFVTQSEILEIFPTDMYFDVKAKYDALCIEYQNYGKAHDVLCEEHKNITHKYLSLNTTLELISAQHLEYKEKNECLIKDSFTQAQKLIEVQAQLKQVFNEYTLDKERSMELQGRLQAQILQLQKEITQYGLRQAQLQQALNTQREKDEQQQQIRRELETKLAETQAAMTRMEPLVKRLHYIESSKVWPLVQLFWKIRDFVIPINSQRRIILLQLLRGEKPSFQKRPVYSAVALSKNNVLVSLRELHRHIVKVKSRYVLLHMESITCDVQMLDMVFNYLDNHKMVWSITPKIIGGAAGEIINAGFVLSPKGLSNTLAVGVGCLDTDFRIDYCYHSSQPSSVACIIRKSSWVKLYMRMQQVSPEPANILESLTVYARELKLHCIYHPDFIVRVQTLPVSVPVGTFLDKILYEKSLSKKGQCILVVDYQVPTFDQDAGSRTNFLYYALLVRLGYVVKLLPDNFYRNPRYVRALHELGIEILHGEYARQNWTLWLKENGTAIDYVYLNRPSIAINYLDAVKKYTSAKIIYLGHDLNYLRDQRGLFFGFRDKNDTDQQKLERAEDRLLSEADISVVFSSFEQKELHDKYPAKEIIWKPLYFFEQERCMPYWPSTRKHLLFVGSYNHPPNRDALEWFVQEVFPLIRNDFPFLELHIVGSNFKPEFITSLGGGMQIKYLGWLSDKQLRAAYQSAALVVVPLRFGAGLKGKVLEALHYGAPLVSTTIGLEGFPQIEALYKGVDTAKDFAQTVVTLYRNPKLRKMLSIKQQEYVQKYFSVAVATKAMAQIFK